MPLLSRLRWWGRCLPIATTVFALLAVWPDAASAFHSPKRWGLLVGAGLGLLLSAPRLQWSALPLVILTLLQPWRDPAAGWSALGFAFSLLAWPSLRPPGRTATRVLLVAAALVAVVVLAQRLGWDPFRSLRPTRGERLSLYGTLGNPDFVASCLLPIAFLGLAERRRGYVIALLPIAAALAVTRSFGTVLGLAMGAAALLAHPAAGHRKRTLLIGVLLFAVMGVSLAGRSPGRVIEGRRYLVAVATPHVLDGPAWGTGIGSVVELWPEWELSWWKARCSDAACVAAHPDGHFTGLQDHLHNDPLEVLIDRGVAGFLTLVLALLVPLSTIGRRRDDSAAFLFAAMIALLGRALIDFPLERPADLCLLALLASLTPAPDDPESSCESPQSASS